MKLQNILTIALISLVVISCQNNNSVNGRISNCELLTFEELNDLVKNDEKEDYLISMNFHKRTEDSKMIYYARCETRINDGGYWTEMVDLKIGKNEFQYTTIENQQYISIKNKVKAKAKSEGKKNGFEAFTVEDKMRYGFRVEGSSSKEPNVFRIVFSEASK